jgi:hypothetical protein
MFRDHPRRAGDVVRHSGECIVCVAAYARIGPENEWVIFEKEKGRISLTLPSPSARDRTRMKQSTNKAQKKQGADMSRYSRKKKKEHGLN